MLFAVCTFRHVCRHFAARCLHRVASIAQFRGGGGCGQRQLIMVTEMHVRLAVYQAHTPRVYILLNTTRKSRMALAEEKRCLIERNCYHTSQCGHSTPKAVRQSMC